MSEKRIPTNEELDLIQSHLSAEDFQTFLKDLEEKNWVKIEDVLLDVPVTDPRGYSLD